MIEYLRGTIAELTPATAIAETSGGVAYELNITLPTYTALDAEGGIGRQIKIFVHEIIREDQWLLYGFVDRLEREIFRQLIAVSGVGANMARLILSAIPADMLGAVIAAGDVAKLKSVKGIGAKTAQRIIVDLKDKITATGSAAGSIEAKPEVNKGVYDDALSALLALGFARSASVKALDKIFDDAPDAAVQDAIRRALAMIK